MKQFLIVLTALNALAFNYAHAFGGGIRSTQNSQVNAGRGNQTTRRYASILSVKDDLKEIEKDFEKRVRLESLLWLFPIGMSASAFMLQRPTSVAFHKLYALVNEKTNLNALELITPALNGPVSTSISILFGTLVAITISSLYGRQDAMHKTLITMGEDLHHGSLLIQGLPPPYSQQAKEYLDDFSHRLCRAFLTGDYRILGYRNHGLNDMVLFLNQLTQQQLLQQQPQQRSDATKDGTILVSATIISQLYDMVSRIQAERSQLLATFRTTFPVWHYFNLAMLAMAICTIFLMESDQAVLKLLDAFEIRTCWAILIGAFSMLGMVCYDLTTPYSGIFRVSAMLGAIERQSIEAYSLTFCNIVCNLQILSSKDVEMEFIEGDEERVSN